MAFFSRVTAKTNPFVKSSSMVTGKGHVDLAEEEVREEDMGAHPGDDAWELEVDVYNTPKEIIIVAQLAGVDTNDLFVKVKEDVLTISGVRKRPASVMKKDEHLFSGECKWGPFERAVILPQNVDVSKINAKLGKDKVLELSIPKTKIEDEQVVRIELED